VIITSKDVSSIRHVIDCKLIVLLSLIKA